MDPASPLLAVAAVALYVAGVRRLRIRGRLWSPPRQVAFFAGSAVVAAALLAPDAGDRDFTVHVVQHLALSMVAPPLLALGAPLTLALQAVSHPTRAALLALLHSRAVTVLTHPLLAWVVFAGSLYALYFTPLYRLSTENVWLHALVHVHFLLTGCLFFWPVVGLDVLPRRLPHAARLLMVFLAIPFHGGVGIALVTSSTLVASTHTLADQRLGGAVMWIGGDVIAIVALLVVLAQWMEADRREAEREDRRLVAAEPDHG